MRATASTTRRTASTSMAPWRASSTSTLATDRRTADRTATGHKDPRDRSRGSLFRAYLERPMNAVSGLLKDECCVHLREGRERIHSCIGRLSEAQVWRRPNANTVSVGNLVLHLCGNVRQWINATLGGGKDTRQRDLEFSEPGPIPSAELL